MSKNQRAGQKDTQGTRVQGYTQGTRYKGTHQGTRVQGYTQGTHLISEHIIQVTLHELFHLTDLRKATPLPSSAHTNVARAFWEVSTTPMGLGTLGDQVGGRRGGEGGGGSSYLGVHFVAH